MGNDRKVDLFTLNRSLADLIISGYPGVIMPEQIHSDGFVGEATRYIFTGLPFSAIKGFVSNNMDYFNYELNDSVTGETLFFAVNMGGEGRTIVDNTASLKIIDELLKTRTIESVMDVANEVAKQQGFKKVTIGRESYSYRKVGESLGVQELAYEALVSCEFSKLD